MKAAALLALLLVASAQLPRGVTGATTVVVPLMAQVTPTQTQQVAAPVNQTNSLNFNGNFPVAGASLAANITNATACASATVGLGSSQLNCTQQTIMQQPVQPTQPVQPAQPTQQQQQQQQQQQLPSPLPLLSPTAQQQQQQQQVVFQSSPSPLPSASPVAQQQQQQQQAAPTVTIPLVVKTTTSTAQMPLINETSTTLPSVNTTAVAGGKWEAASMTWYGPGDSVGSYNPVSTGLGNCLQNAHSTLGGDKLQKYAKFYAGVNDGGPLFGMGSCRPNPSQPEYPICDNQQNCGKCYELRCVSPCYRFPNCPSKCKPGTVTVLMVDACPADSIFQVRLEQQNGWNGCRAAAKSDTNHFDVAPAAMNALREGDSGEVGIEFREVPC